MNELEQLIIGYLIGGLIGAVVALVINAIRLERRVRKLEEQS